MGELADICLNIRAVHHNGGVVLAHMCGKASRDFIADMAVRLRARHADDVLAPIRARGRISSGREAPRDLRNVLGHRHDLLVGATQRQDCRSVPVSRERVRLFLRIAYRVCSGRSGVLEACARSAASSSAGKLLPLFTARLRIP